FDMCLVFCFFQAEDGIRDFHVTGVQTCALPILMLTGISTLVKNSDISGLLFPSKLEFLNHIMQEVDLGNSDFRGWIEDGIFTRRSEERRVGKECRARWRRWIERETKRVQPRVTA